MVRILMDTCCQGVAMKFNLVPVHSRTVTTLGSGHTTVVLIMFHVTFLFYSFQPAGGSVTGKGIGFFCGDLRNFWSIGVGRGTLDTFPEYL